MGQAPRLARCRKTKETELVFAFIRDIIETLLGYVGQPAETYTLKREALVKVDGKFADAALGRFGPGDAAAFIAAVEGKGPLIDHWVASDI